MLDPTSQLFNDAVAITGLPEWKELGRGYRLLTPAQGEFHDTWWTMEGEEFLPEPHWVFATGVRDFQAEALLEHHFRVYLDPKGVLVNFRNPDYVAGMHPLFDDENVPYGQVCCSADTYLECQMKVIVEIGQ